MRDEWKIIPSSSIQNHRRKWRQPGERRCKSTREGAKVIPEGWKVDPVMKRVGGVPCERHRHTGGRRQQVFAAEEDPSPSRRNASSKHARSLAAHSRGMWCLATGVSWSQTQSSPAASYRNKRRPIWYPGEEERLAGTSRPPAAAILPEHASLEPEPLANEVYLYFFFLSFDLLLFVLAFRAWIRFNWCGVDLEKERELQRERRSEEGERKRGGLFSRFGGWEPRDDAGDSTLERLREEREDWEGWRCRKLVTGAGGIFLRLLLPLLGSVTVVVASGEVVRFEGDIEILEMCLWWTSPRARSSSRSGSGFFWTGDRPKIPGGCSEVEVILRG